MNTRLFPPCRRLNNIDSISNKLFPLKQPSVGLYLIQTIHICDCFYMYPWYIYFLNNCRLTFWLYKVIVLSYTYDTPPLRFLKYTGIYPFTHLPWRPSLLLCLELNTCCIRYWAIPEMCFLMCRIDEKRFLYSNFLLHCSFY